jgi:glycosyltransferase involved in cell wall biosynthesis
VLEILRAFQQSRSNRRLIVAGDHLAKTGYIEQLRAVRDPRIRMIGTVYDQVKLTCLRYHSFAYLHGHSVGGTNPSLLEAMGCGNLIIAQDNPFNRETLGPCGYYFANVPGLTKAIDLAEREDQERARLREACRTRACTEYRWPDVISRYVALLEKKSKV